jgi:hypothetical protein
MATKTAISPLLLSGNVESLVAQMTVEEKCAFLSGRTWWESVPIPRLGIPSLFMTDGPHGVRKGVWLEWTRFGAVFGAKSAFGRHFVRTRLQSNPRVCGVIS